MSHRALHNFDILLEIMEYLRQNDSCIKGERGNLARSARVCRSFSEPALRVLWRTLDDLNPLFLLLRTLEILKPEQAVGENTEEERFNMIPPLEIPQQTWARFQLYASYVRTVRRYVTQSKSSIWITLASRIGSEPLFPCLRSVELDLDSSSCTKMLCFIAPSIRSLVISAKFVRDQSLEAFLDAVTTISPNAVWTLATTSSIFHRMEFRHFSALRKLEIKLSSHAPDSFEKPSHLDRLNDLVVSHGDGMARPIGRGCFAALQDMEIMVRAEDPLLELLTDFSFPRLQSARVSIYGLSNIAANRRILDALCSGSPPLCILTLVCGEWGYTAHPLMEILEPLLALGGMKELHISARAHLCVSKDDIRTMAQSWPELEFLQMSYSCVEPAPPIQSIVEFAHHCPHLQELVFPRFSCVSHTFPATTPSLCGERWIELEELDIDDDDIELCRKAAAFIEDPGNSSICVSILRPQIGLKYATFWRSDMLIRTRICHNVT